LAENVGGAYTRRGAYMRDTTVPSLVFLCLPPCNYPVPPPLLSPFPGDRCPFL